MSSLDPLSPTEPSDPWKKLSRFTPARIGLGRTGGSLLTKAQLDFRLAHARARDAVQAPFLLPELTETLQRLQLSTVHLSTLATNRQQYLLRPDLGRTLTDSSRSLLQGESTRWGSRNLAILISDGLAAQAANLQAVPTLQPLIDTLARQGWSFYPIFLVPFARVKLQDEVGEILGARHTLMLLGERPGLGSPDSLGAYFTYRPQASCRDAQRNCVSNIRPEGFPPPQAARKIAQLLIKSAQKQVSGVDLKDTDLPLLD